MSVATEPLLRPEDIAKRLDLPLSSVYEAARQGRIGGVVRLGRRVRFEPGRFEAWIAAGGSRQESTEEGAAAT